MAITEVRNNYVKAEKPADPTPKPQEIEENTYRSTEEYYDYLRSKYSCLQRTNNNTVTIAPNLLSKAAKDNKTGQWLEENLKLIPDALNKVYQHAAQNGLRVASCTIRFDAYGSITTQAYTVTEVKTRKNDIKKVLDEMRAKNKEQKKQQEELLEKREESHRQRFLTNNVENLLQKVEHHDFTHKNNADRVSIDFKI